MKNECEKKADISSKCEKMPRGPLESAVTAGLEEERV